MSENITTKRIAGKRFYFTAHKEGLLATDERGGCYGAYKDVDDFVSYYAENGETLFISIGVLDFSSCNQS